MVYDYRIEYILALLKFVSLILCTQSKGLTCMFRTTDESSTINNVLFMFSE